MFDGHSGNGMCLFRWNNEGVCMAASGSVIIWYPAASATQNWQYYECRYNVVGSVFLVDNI
jgi:hypothetical protein